MEKRVGADLSFHSATFAPFIIKVLEIVYKMEEKTKGCASSQVIVQEL